MTRDQLLAAVRVYSNRPNLPLSDFLIMLQTVEGKLNKELRDHPRNIRREAIEMPDDSGLLPLPDDLARIISVFDDTGTYRQYPPSVPPEDMERGYIQRGDVLQLTPVPAAGAEIGLDYHAYLSSLTNAESENWLSRYHADVYLYACLIEVAVYVKDDARLQAWQQEFLLRLSALKVQGWDQNVASSPRPKLR